MYRNDWDARTVYQPGNHMLGSLSTRLIVHHHTSSYIHPPSIVLHICHLPLRIILHLNLAFGSSLLPKWLSVLPATKIITVLRTPSQFILCDTFIS